MLKTNRRSFFRAIAGLAATGLTARGALAQASTEEGTDVGAATEVIEMIGTVRCYDPKKSYGFVQPDAIGAPEVLLHVTALRVSDFQSAKSGMRIHFEALKRPKGMQVFRVISLDGVPGRRPKRIETGGPITIKSIRYPNS